MAQITINTKFEIGQEVYIIKEGRERLETKQTCEACFGKGYFDYKGHTYRCAKCDGKGQVILDSKVVKRYVVADSYPHKITSARYSIYGEKAQKDGVRPLRYKVNDKYIEEERLFATLEEAESACQELNISQNSVEA